MADKPYVCGKCGAALSVDCLKEWNGRILKTCPYCHHVELLEEDADIAVERIKSKRISQIENRRLDIQERAMRHVRIKIKAPTWLRDFFEIFGPYIIGVLIIFSVIGAIVWWHISPPEDAGYYRGKVVTEAVRSFRDAGFFNVSTIPIEDGRSIGRVDHVTISGESAFYKGFVLFFHDRSTYGRTAPVVIYYHTEKPK